MGYTPPPLGERMHSLGLVLHGSMLPARWIEFLHEVTRAIGMNAVADPVSFDYPIDGKGGTGQTIFMPITESFIVLDTWSDHSGAYLFVCSCRPYYSADIDKVAAAFGLKAGRVNGGRFYFELSLK